MAGLFLMSSTLSLQLTALYHGNLIWINLLILCYFYYLSNDFVVAGEWNLATDEGTEQKVGVQQTIKNKDYNPNTLENDIALVKLVVGLYTNCKLFSLNCLHFSVYV